jgi:hypothetical protein
MVAEVGGRVVIEAAIAAFRTTLSKVIRLPRGIWSVRAALLTSCRLRALPAKHLYGKSVGASRVAAWPMRPQVPGVKVTPASQIMSVKARYLGRVGL